MKQKIKNIFFFPFPTSGGIERNLDLWIEKTSKQIENKNYLLSNIDNPKISEQAVFKPKYIVLKRLISKDSDTHLKKNVIVFRNIFKPLIWTIYLRLLGFKGIKLIYRANNDPLHWWHEGTFKRIISEIVKIFILPLYDLVIYNSQELKDRCRHYNKNYSVLPNSIDYKDKIIFKNNNSEILFVGRDAKQKNIKNLISAMSIIDKNINLTVIGFENTKYDAPENVKFINWSNKIDYSKYSYIVLPSLYEGSPNALLEGLNNGLIPIITPFKSGGIELVSAFRCKCFISKDFSADSLAKTIVKAVTTDVHFETCTPTILRHDYFENRLQEILTSA